MSTVRYSLLSQPPVAVTGANYPTDPAAYPPFYLPASNAARLNSAHRAAQSLDTTSGVIIFDFGITVSIEAFSVEGMNFGSLLIEGSDDGSSWTTIGTYDTTFLDLYDGRRKKICIPDTPFYFRYARFTPSYPEAAVYIFCIIGAWSVLTAMTAAINAPYDRESDEATESQQRGDGGTEEGVPTPTFLKWTIVGLHHRDNPTKAAEFQSINLVPKGRVFLWWDEWLGPEKIYHVKKIGGLTFSAETAVAERLTNLRLAEVV